MKVLIVPNYTRDDALEAASEITTWLEDNECEVVWAHDRKYDGQRVCNIEGVSLVITLGGDGTLLRAAQIVGYTQIPILGISFGHLGFLTTVGAKDYIASVARALSGDLHLSRRATLDIAINVDMPDGTCHTYHYFALNELALTRGPLGDMIEFDVSVSGNKIDTLRGDGFVVSTSTGSTGYALSAGGPFVTPEFNGMVCVPIAPHTILARAFLTSPSDVVDLDIVPERTHECTAFVDGTIVEEEGIVTSVSVSRGPGDIILFDEGAQSFYDSVSRVFWGGEKKCHD